MLSFLYICSLNIFPTPPFLSLSLSLFLCNNCWKMKKKADSEMSKLILPDTVSAFPPLSQRHPLLIPQQAAPAAAPSASRKRTRPGDGVALLTEKGRRDNMTNLYGLLQDMVPNLFPKATRVKIVSDTTEYIKDLERRRDTLEMIKRSREAVLSATAAAATPILVSQCCSTPDSSLRVTVSGNVAFFGIQTSRFRRGLAAQIIIVFERHDAQVLAANVAASHGSLTVTVTACVGDNADDLIHRIVADIRNL